MKIENTATPKWEWIVVTGFLLVVALVGLRPSIRGNDGLGHYAYLASALSDGDLDLSDDYAALDHWKDSSWFRDRPLSSTGRPVNRYGIGAALFWSPFAGAVHYALQMLDPAAATTTGRPYEWAIGLGTVFWSSLALLLLYGRLRAGFGPMAAGLTLIGLLGATPLGFYVYLHGSMSHGVSFFAVTAAMMATEMAWRHVRPGPYLLCGVCCGLMIMTRYQNLPWALVSALALSLAAVRTASGSRARRFGRVAFLMTVFIGAATVAFLPQMSVWRVIYGSWLSGPAPYLGGLGGRLGLWPHHGLAVLFSERGGALAWHPILLLALAGLIALPRRRPAWRLIALAGLGGFVLQVWLIGSWSMWWGGASFGNRFFISCLPWMAGGMALWFSARTGLRRTVAAGVLALLVAWNAGLLIQYGTQMIPRETSVPWGRVIRQNLTQVPVWVFERLF